MSNGPQGAGGSAQPIRVLLVEPDAAEAERIRALLGSASGVPFAVDHAPGLEDALAALGGGAYDVALLDVDTPGQGRATALERIREISTLPAVCLADSRATEPALAALRGGARDCLVRGRCDAPLLVRALRHAVEHRRFEDELEGHRRRERYRATHDGLTGLPNRFAFEEQLRRVIEGAARREKSLAVLFLGLDRFRNVNDSMGHGVGDELLVQVAGRLRGALRRSDLVARVGGDEFVALLDDVKRGADAARVAAKLGEALGPAYAIGGRECWVPPSIGIALFPRDGAEADPLIRNAYAAMREAKSGGGGDHRFFSQTMNETNRRRMHLETRLRRALERGELELHYQPKVETATGRITGAEALLRWTDRELGEVEPKTIIPIAEETGLIAAIGEWSLRTACAQNAEWQRAGFPLRVSVNLSARQIVDEGLREKVVRALWDTGLPPDRLELEITESALMRNEEAASRHLSELKSVGVVVSLDDFGTGFSSLSYLKRFPVDILKIDQSFVRDIAVDPDDAAIVGAIISIAENLDLGVIAEGVETEEQRAFLLARGCAEMQGFLASPAVPAEAFTELLRKQEAGVL